jgi:hypothetical protein
MAFFRYKLAELEKQTQDYKNKSTFPYALGNN